jgi:CubicO group peptidase (beta-lactamase class C family)
VPTVEDLFDEVDRIALETSFSGVVSIDTAAGAFAKAYGFADRRWRIANEVDTCFAIASGTKGLTAVTVVSLIEDGTLELTTPARTLLGDALPLVRDDVTVEHLLAHRSGIGDYFDEEVETDVDAYLLDVPAHELASTEAYLRVLDGHATKFMPDERFAYCNGGYVLLALMAERASGVPFHELVVDRVCKPAAMRDTSFVRSDELPGRTAIGYVQVDGAWRTNVFHLPVRGSGDGGIYTTVSDVHSFWAAFLGGSIVSGSSVREMVRPRSEADTNRYGLGFWLDGATDAVMLEGMDAGVSFRSTHDPQTGSTYTVVSNTSTGAWPIVRYLMTRRI